VVGIKSGCDKGNGRLRVAVLVLVTAFSLGLPRATAFADESLPHLGGMMKNLVGPERALFRKGSVAFQRVTSVQGGRSVSGTEQGLGPFFNLDSCAGCHAHPAVGGTSPTENPQIGAASKAGGLNQVPAFMKRFGPIYQARRRHGPNGRPDGSIFPLFSIAGRSDAPGCNLPQLDVDGQWARGNLSLHVPTPVFGSGLIEAIPDTEITDATRSDRERKRRAGIAGRPSRVSAYGPIARFGWKAQGLSLQQFTEEAYFSEEGVTGELYGQKFLSPPAQCIFNVLPEDRPNTLARTFQESLTNASLIVAFLRFLAAPEPQRPNEYGRKLFDDVGCGLCHAPRMRTGKSAYAVLSDRDVDLFSDLLLHHMGNGLADGINQGAAGPDEFRTAPLWGVGQRLFLLHDGRAASIGEAIEAHFSKPTHRTPASEANNVVAAYRNLRPSDRQALIDFLKSL